MPRLHDGTIVPHYLATEAIGILRDPGVKTNISLRPGEVKAIVYPTDAKSISKTWIEYSVEVQHRDGHLPGTVTTYPNCWVVNAFGGVADRCTYTLRADSGATQNQSGGTGLGNGSKVLLLCINGDQPNAVILGGLRDKKDATDQQSDGHHLAWSFNGIEATIDDTGELELSFTGATNADGSQRSDVTPGAPGSKVKFSDDGSVTLSQGNQTIIIDTPNKNITLTSGGYNVKIDSTGTKLGDPSALDAMYKGTSHRTLDRAMHTTILTALATLSTLLGTLSAAVGTASVNLAAAAVSLVIPIVGAMLAAIPVAAAAVALGTAAATIGSMVAAVGVLTTAINTFEASAQSTLSLQNFVS